MQHSIILAITAWLSRRLCRFSACRRTSSALTRCGLYRERISFTFAATTLRLFRLLLGLTLPELLGRILARNPLEDLSSTRMLIYKVRDVVNGLVDHNIHALFEAVVGLHLLCADCF